VSSPSSCLGAFADASDILSCSFLMSSLDTHCSRILSLACHSSSSLCSNCPALTSAGPLLIERSIGAAAASTRGSAFTVPRISSLWVRVCGTCVSLVRNNVRQRIRFVRVPSMLRLGHRSRGRIHWTKVLISTFSGSRQNDASHKFPGETLRRFLIDGRDADPLEYPRMLC
jgi:hypothetical protein